MQARKVILLVVALLVAGATVFVARTMLQASHQQQALAPQAAPKPPHEILVAAKDLPSGTVLKDGDLKWQTWPETEGNTDYTVKSGAGEALADNIGHVVRTGLRAGEPIVPGRIVKPGDHGFMAAILAPGMRAIAIPLTPAAGVAGFIHPGDHVDVIVTHKLENRNRNSMEGRGRLISETVLSDVRILAIDQKTSDQDMTATDVAGKPAKPAEFATVEVTGKQAETVALARELGTLTLTLRSLANGPSPEQPSTGVSAALPDEGNGDEQPSPIQTASPPDVAIDAATLALPKENAGVPNLTWDSDVSHVLPRPANPYGTSQKITIIRGKESTEAQYDLPAP